MTEFRPDRDPGAQLDADALADLLDALHTSGWEGQPPVDDSRVAVARRLAEAPHPVMRSEASARIEAQLMAAAQHMPGARLQRAPRRISWPLAAAAALVLALAAVLVPEITEQTAAPVSPTPTATYTTTPTATPTLTVTVTPSVTPTLTVTGVLTETTSPTPEALEVVPAADATPEPVQEQSSQDAAEYDCANPPPDNAQALGWRQHCEGDVLPPGQGGVPPGQSEESPGNSGNAPGQQKK